MKHQCPYVCLTYFTEGIMSVRVVVGGVDIGRTFCEGEVVDVILQTQSESFRASKDP